MIKFATYNILNGGVGREDLILQVLRASRPDIAMLQEVTRQQTVQEMAQALDVDFFFAQGNTSRHLALLSRLPIISQQSWHPFPPIRAAILEATVEPAPGKHIYLLGVHLVPHPAILLELWRAWEMRVVLQRARQHDAQPCLIAGDFNAVAPNDRVVTKSMPVILKLMLLLQGWRFFHYALEATRAAGFTDCYRFLHPDQDGFTLPTPSPTIRLDYILANDALKASLQKCHVVREPAAIHQASDHYPLVAEFAF
jgi:exonuclease III